MQTYQGSINAPPTNHTPYEFRQPAKKQTASGPSAMQMAQNAAPSPANPPEMSMPSLPQGNPQMGQQVLNQAFNPTVPWGPQPQAPMQLPQADQQMGQQAMQMAMNPMIQPWGQQQPGMQLPQGMSLQDLLSSNIPFPMMQQYGMSGASAMPIGTGTAANRPAQRQSPSAGRPSINSGMTMPEVPRQPQVNPSWIQQSGAMGQGAAGAAQRAFAPSMMQQQGNWHAQNAGMNNQFQQAQAQSGLDWASISQALASLMNQQQSNQQQNAGSLIRALR